MNAWYVSASILGGALFACTVLFAMLYTPSTYALGSAADAMCAGCSLDPKSSRFCPRVVCIDVTNNLTTMGHCKLPGKCQGETGQGLGGGAQEALGMLKSILDLLKGGGGGGGAGSFPTTTDAFGQGCTQYYQVSVPSSDPCAIYSPTTIPDALGGTSGVSQNLLNALQGGSASPVSETLLKGEQSSTGGGTSQTPSQQETTQTPSSGDSVSLIPGLSGDVRIGSAGATIIANLREGFSEVASFFGGSTLGDSESLTVAGRICATRPWAGGFIANVIPTAFFDGLCEWRGYQVGVAIAPQATSVASGVRATPQASNQPRPPFPFPESDVPPEADIWAEPTSVRLGTRTYIFWNARGVISCIESGPSFSQNSLSGGASTVPISGPTTFNIECLTTASSTISDSVTVQIAI